MTIIDRGLLNATADLGEIAALFPAAVGLALALALQSQRREAAAWSAALLLCIGATFALKWTLGSFSIRFSAHEFTTMGFPSGHAALSTCFYGALAVLVCQATARTSLSIIAILLAVAVVAAVIGAVWALHWHGPLDLVGGALLGFSCVALFGWLSAGSGATPRVIVLPLVTAATIIVSLHGVRLKYEATHAAGSVRLLIRQPAAPSASPAEQPAAPQEIAARARAIAKASE